MHDAVLSFVQAANLADPEFTQLFPELCSPQQRQSGVRDSHSRNLGSYRFKSPSPW